MICVSVFSQTCVILYFAVLIDSLVRSSVCWSFLVADKRLYKRLCPSVGPSVGPSKSGKTCISFPAHPSATGIGRVSGLVSFCFFFSTAFLHFLHSVMVSWAC